MCIYSLASRKPSLDRGSEGRIGARHPDPGCPQALGFAYPVGDVETKHTGLSLITYQGSGGRLHTELGLFAIAIGAQTRSGSKVPVPRQTVGRACPASRFKAIAAL